MFGPKEKLAEDIRRFTADKLKLEQFVRQYLLVLDCRQVNLGLESRKMVMSLGSSPKIA